MAYKSLTTVLQHAGIILLFVFQSVGAHKDAEVQKQIQEQHEQRFLNTYGENWCIFWNEQRNSVKSLVGTYDFGMVADTMAAKSLADKFIVDIIYLTNIERKELRHVAINYDTFLDRYKITFKQFVNGVEIRDSKVTLFVSGKGVLYDFQNHTYPDVTIDTKPTISENQAIQFLKSNYDLDLFQEESPAISLKVLPLYRDEALNFMLIYEVNFTLWTFFIDAKTGELIDDFATFVEDEYYFGNITGKTFPTNEPNNDAVTTPLPYTLVSLYENSPSQDNHDCITNHQGNYQTILSNNLEAWLFYTRLEAGYDKFRVFDFEGPGIEHNHFYDPGEREYNYTFPTSKGHHANIYYHLTRIWDFFKSTYDFERPYVKAVANDPNVTGRGFATGNEVHFSTDGGRAVCSIQHEYVHDIVWYIKGGWIIPENNYDYDTYGGLNEAFPVYYPCLNNASQYYIYPKPWNIIHDLGANDGTSCVQDWNNDGIIDELDHVHYDNKFAIAAVWWELKDIYPDFNNFLWRVLDALPQHDYRPRDFFNRSLLLDDDNTNFKDLTPHFNEINQAYKNHGMNYYPVVESVNRSGSVADKFFEKDEVYCQAHALPTSQRVDIYVVRSNANRRNNDVLNDVSGVVETVWSDIKGQISPTLIWSTGNGDAGEYDIIVDVDRNGKYDGDFDGIIDGCDGLNSPGLSVKQRSDATVQNSPYPLHMPFSPGTTWQVGGVGNFYGEGGHTDTNNDYYATDWNRVGGDDLNQTVYPVAPGKVVETGNDKFYGNYIDIVHSFESQPKYGVIKTRYAHLNGIDVATGDIVYINTPIGKVGNTGNSTEPHLHLSFRIFNGTNFISLSNADPSRKPCPMVAYSNGQYQLWEFKDGESRTAAAKQFFSDVPNGFWAKPWVDAVYAWGVMEPYPAGQKNLFNPDVPVTRAYIAQFWVKAYHGPDYTPPRATGTVFNDVPADYWAAPWIEQLYRDGFTKGCSEDPPLYCPEDDVKRAEVAVFILRALHGSDYYPPNPTGHVFDDAPYDYWGTKWVEQLAKEGITAGCSLNPPLFCPENPVTRAEMAVFLLRAFGIYPPVIGGHGGAPEEPRTWEAQLVVKDAGNGQGTLVFGKSVTATEALDAAFNESELPPLPPSGSFDARFELPSMPGVGTLRDFRPTQQNETTWKIRFQPGIAGYPITLSWSKVELPSGVFILKDEITGNIISVDMKTQETLTVTNPGIASLLIHESSLFIRNIDVSAGWNLLSVPTRADNMRVTSLFPNAGSEAYYFDNGYVMATELNAGVGYWLKFAQPYKFSMSGQKILDRTLPMKQGWNMIGPFETDVFITDIITAPANIVQTSYYGFENGYLPVSILRVGKGYWVKVNQAGVLTLPEGAGFSKDLVASTLIDKLHSWPRITITDTNDGQATLYLMPRDAKAHISSFELPPVPPQGLFDIRFAGDHFVERLDKAVFALKLSGEHYPLTVIAQNLGDLELTLQAQQGAWSEILFEGQEVILEHRMDQLSIVANATNSLPSHYELSQNYPNPFNPVTTIQFALPEATHVKMTLYNALGAKVAELLDSTISAGYHELDVDASHYASGIYFYTLETPAFKDMKKMVVLK